jgi:hypothetical protein
MQDVVIRHDEAAARLDRITGALTRCRSCWRTGYPSGPPICPVPMT